MLIPHGPPAGTDFFRAESRAQSRDRCEFRVARLRVLQASLQDPLRTFGQTVSEATHATN